MKESIWGYAILTLGLLAVGIIWFFANVTRNDQHNYNLLKETAESAMVDAIDLAAYRKDGTIKIEEEKFVENFIRRFAENADLSNEYYEIEIYDVREIPPKVSLKVSSAKRTNPTGEIVEFDIVNNIDAILEAKYLMEIDASDQICQAVRTKSLAPGTEYICKVSERRDYRFYLLNRESDGKVNLIMRENLVNANLPKSLSSRYLKTYTNDWTVSARIPTTKDIAAASGFGNSSEYSLINRRIPHYWLRSVSNRYWISTTSMYYGSNYGLCVDNSGRILTANYCGLKAIITVAEDNLYK